MQRGEKVLVRIKYPDEMNAIAVASSSKFKEGIVERLAANEHGGLVKLVGDDFWYTGHDVYQITEEN